MGNKDGRIAALMISSFEPLPGSVRNDGRALVKEGVVHAQLVESPLHPILKRLTGDRLNHRRQERETVRCVVELLACSNKRINHPALHLCASQHSL